MTAQGWTNEDIDTFAERLRAWGETLPVAERRLLAELLAVAGESSEVDAFGFSGVRAAAVAAALTAAAGLGVGMGAASGNGPGAPAARGTDAAAQVATAESGAPTPAPSIESANAAKNVATAPAPAPAPAPSAPAAAGSRTHRSQGGGGEVVVGIDASVSQAQPEPLGDDIARPDQPDQRGPRPPQEDDRRGQEQLKPPNDARKQDPSTRTETVSAPGHSGARYYFAYDNGKVSDFGSKPDPDPNAKPDPRVSSEVTGVVCRDAGSVITSVTFRNTTDHRIVFDNTLRLHLLRGSMNDVQEVDLRGVTLDPGQARVITVEHQVPENGDYAIWLETM